MTYVKADPKMYPAFDVLQFDPKLGTFPLITNDVGAQNCDKRLTAKFAPYLMLNKRRSSSQRMSR
jgi:hypothetical protein